MNPVVKSLRDSIALFENLENREKINSELKAVCKVIAEAKFQKDRLIYDLYEIDELIVKLRNVLVRKGLSAYDLPQELSASIEFHSIGLEQKLNTSSSYRASAFVTRQSRDASLTNTRFDSDADADISEGPASRFRKIKLQLESDDETSIAPENFGIAFQPYYLHVLLLNTLHGHKDKVRKEIDEWMNLYDHRTRTLAHDRIYKASSDTNTPKTPEKLEKSKEMLRQGEAFESELWRANPLLLKPVHATSIGSFDHCSIFCGPDLRSSRLLMYMEHVTAKVSLQGSIPTTRFHDEDIDYKGNGLFQNHPERVLRPFPHDQLSKDAQVNTASDYSGYINPPIVATIQLQINSLLTTSGGLCVVVPLIAVVDKVLRNAALESGKQVKGLLALSKNWSSATIILRCEDFDDMVLAINGLAALTLRDIFRVWPKKLSNQKKKTSDRLKELSSALFDAGESRLPRGYDWYNSNNHVFARSFSIPSILYPFEKDAALCQRGATGKVTAQDLKLRFNRWRLEGDVRTQTRFHTRPGHYNQLGRWLQQFSWSRDQLDEGTRSSTISSTVGHYDFSVSDDFLEPRDGRSDRAFRVIGKLALIQQGLAKGALDLNLQPNEIDLEKDIPDALPDTPVSMETEIGSHVVQKFDSDQGFPHQNLTQTYDRAIRRYLNTKNASFSEIEERLHPLLSARRIAHNHVASLLEIGSSWTSGLRALIDADVLVGLTSAWEVGLRMLEKLLQDPAATTQQIQHFITDFTRPFSRAFEHRKVVNNSSSDPGAGFEFNGTLQSVTIAMEECLRGFAALLSEQTNTATLAILSDFPDIRINLHRSPALSLSELTKVAESEWLYGFVRINYKLAQEPARIHVAIHEMLHLLVASREFGASIQAIQHLETDEDKFIENVDLFQVLHGHDRSTGKNADWQRRIEEITVEYLLGFIIFSQGNDLELYSRVFAIQLTLEPGANDQTKFRNNELQVEMLARCLTVTKMLKGFSDWFSWGDWEDQWLDNIKPYLNPDSFAEADTARQIRLTLQRWRHSDLDQYLPIIVSACHHFFGFENQSDLTPGMRMRKKFAEKLADSYGMTKQKEPVTDPKREFLLQEFSFRRVPEVDEGRVGSLIEFVIAIREYYRCLVGTIEGMTDVRNHGSFVLRRNKEGHVDFREHGGQDGPALLLNSRDSSLFWASPQAQALYTRLRVDFNQSMYHISERSRYREIMWLFNSATRTTDTS